MKQAIFALAALLALSAFAPEAEAVVCARGYRGAGCAGYHGAVGVRRAPVVVAPQPVARCAWVNGRRVCRY